MEALFLKAINLNFRASWIIIAIILVRLFLKDAPKKYRIWLWMIVAIRLVVPFSLQSVFSLLPKGDVIPNNIMYLETPTIDSGIPVINQVVNPVLVDHFSPVPTNSVNPLQVVTYIASIVWLIGSAILFFYFFASSLLLKKKLKNANLVEDRVYTSDEIDAPFVYGMFFPCIYLPTSISDDERKDILLHERMHIKRKDYFIKPIAFLITSFYWFNPLLWLSYSLLSKDIEYACDEEVLEQLNESEKQHYAKTLLKCAYKSNHLELSPVAFGESNVKKRILQIIKYQKPSTILKILFVGLSVLIAIGCLSDPRTDDNSRDEEVNETNTPEPTNEPDNSEETNVTEDSIVAFYEYDYSTEGNSKKYILQDSSVAATIDEFIKTLSDINESSDEIFVFQNDGIESLNDGVIQYKNYSIGYNSTNFDLTASDKTFNAYYISLITLDGNNPINEKNYLIKKGHQYGNTFSELLDTLHQFPYETFDINQQEAISEDNLLSSTLGEYSVSMSGSGNVILNMYEDNNVIYVSAERILKQEVVATSQFTITPDDINDLYSSNSSFRATIQGAASPFSDGETYLAMLRDGRYEIEPLDNDIVFTALDVNDNAIMNSGIQFSRK